ncbi:MAG TPA: hypothetical protein VHJ82_00905 [Actinomycetota bacterium]|nr:hypothetical protein [Actinomycetota bacterium]
MLGLLGGFLLAGFGRGLHLDQGRLVLSGVALSILTAGLTIGAARWGSPDLDHIRGAQAVLGPALLVGPTQVAIATACAAAAALLAGIVWLGSLPGINRSGWIGYGLEVSLVAGTLLAVFWWPAAHSESFATGRLASVIVATALGVTLVGLGVWEQRSWQFARSVALVAGALLVAGVFFTGGPA